MHEPGHRRQRKIGVRSKRAVEKQRDQQTIACNNDQNRHPQQACTIPYQHDSHPILSLTPPFQIDEQI